MGSCAESEGFHKLSMVVSDGLRDIVSENDLLLLSKEKVSSMLAGSRQHPSQFSGYYSVPTAETRSVLLLNLKLENNEYLRTTYIQD